jgi:hypothetical protein
MRDTDRCYWCNKVTDELYPDPYAMDVHNMKADEVEWGCDDCCAERADDI